MYHIMIKINDYQCMNKSLQNDNDFLIMYCIYTGQSQII